VISKQHPIAVAQSNSELTENVECKLPVGSRSSVIGCIVESKNMVTRLRHVVKPKRKELFSQSIKTRQSLTATLAAYSYCMKLTCLPYEPLLEIKLIDVLRSRESVDGLCSHTCRKPADNYFVRQSDTQTSSSRYAKTVIQGCKKTTVACSAYICESFHHV
jgi:hypothetical protein